VKVAQLAPTSRASLPAGIWLTTPIAKQSQQLVLAAPQRWMLKDSSQDTKVLNLNTHIKE
jgi:hypothetical protein